MPRNFQFFFVFLVQAEEIAKDEKLICEASEFLVLNQIPTLVRDCLAFTVMPQDGHALVEIFHQR